MQEVGVATLLKIQGPIRPCHPNLIPDCCQKGKVPIVAPKGLPMEATYIVGQHAVTMKPKAAKCASAMGTTA